MGRVRQMLPLLGIIAAALALRVVFFTGVVVHFDSLAYVKAASDLVQGRPLDLFGNPHMATRLGMTIPIALAYKVAGVNDVTSLWWPFACSLASVLLVYAAGREAAGEPAGLIAAALWAVFPLDVCLATSVLPDGPLATLSAASVLAFWMAGKHAGRRALAWYGICAGLLAITTLVKPTGMITAGFLALWAFWRGRRQRVLWVVGIMTALLTWVAYAYYARLLPKPQVPPTIRLGGWLTLRQLAETGTDWFRATATAADTAAFLPLVVVAIAVLSATGDRTTRWLLAWAATTFLYLELGTREPYAYIPWNPTTHLLRQGVFASVPALILVGCYLGRGLTRFQAVLAVAPALVVTVVCAVLASQDAPRLPAWLLGQPEGVRPFVDISGVAAIGAVFGAIASPLLLRVDSHGAKPVLTSLVLLLSVGLASLKGSYEGSVSYRTVQSESTRELARFLDSQPDHPWLVQNGALELRLDYESRFLRRYEHMIPEGERRDAGLGIVDGQEASIKSAYVIVDGGARAVDPSPFDPGPPYLRTPPSTWWEMRRFGQIPGHQLRVYRVLTHADASRELEAAKRAFLAAPTAENRWRLSGAEINAGDLCAGVERAWNLVRNSNEEISEQLLNQFSACVDDHPAMVRANLLENGDFEKGLAGWYRLPSAHRVGIESTGASTPTLRVTAANSNPRGIIVQRPTFLPRTPYLFEASIKSTAPVVALYWESDVGRYKEEGKFDNWTTIRYVFVTPLWDGKPRAADVFPILLAGPGEVLLRNVRLSPINLGAGRIP